MFLETEHKSSEVKGLFSALVNLYLKFVAKNFNTTIKFIAYPGLGDKVADSDAFTGCFGQVQRGEADTMVAVLDYPMDIVNVTQGYVVFDDRIGFIGSFPSVKFEPHDFTGTFSSFDVPIWLTIIAFLLFFHIFIWIKLKLTVEFYSPQDKLIRRNDYTYRILTHFLMYGEIESNDSTMRVIYISLSFFSFLILSVFFILMKTGLVLSKPPKIFENYDHLIKDEVTPTFLTGLYAHMYFKHGESGSEENKLWTWATEKFGEDEMMRVPKPMEIIGISFQICNYKRVFFSSLDVIESLRSSMCNLLLRKEQNLKLAMKALATFGIKEQVKDLYFQTYIRFGDNMKWMTKQVIFSRKSKYVKLITQLISRALEHGHVVYNRREMRKLNMIGKAFENFDQIIGKADSSRRFLVEKCLSSHPQDEERTADEMSIVTLFSLRASMKILAVCVLIDFSILTFELIYFEWHSRPKLKASPPIKKPEPKGLKLGAIRSKKAKSRSSSRVSQWRYLNDQSRIFYFPP